MEAKVEGVRDRKEAEKVGRNTEGREGGDRKDLKVFVC